MTPLSLTLVFTQFAAMLLVAPLFTGCVRACKARLQNRRGPSVFLPYVALLSLLKKEMTITRYSSWVFRVVPFVVLGSALALAALVPTILFGAVPASLSNIFLIGGIAALGAVFLVLGGMDTASTFGNMGSSREMTLAALVEPALYVTLATLGILAGTFGLDGIVAYFATHPWSATVPLASFTLLALLFVVLAENARYPVDNPATHLELTMVHEAMVLEYSGPYLAMLEYASMLKLVVTSLLLANLVAPFWLLTAPFSLFGAVLALAGLLAKIALAALGIALVETLVVKMRFYRMQEYMALALLLALLGFALVSFGLFSLV